MPKSDVGLAKETNSLICCCSIICNTKMLRIGCLETGGKRGRFPDPKIWLCCGTQYEIRLVLKALETTFCALKLSYLLSLPLVHFLNWVYLALSNPEIDTRVRQIRMSARTRTSRAEAATGLQGFVSA